MHENELPFINGGEHIAWAPDIPIWLSLVVIVGTLAVTAVVCLWASSRMSDGRAGRRHRPASRLGRRLIRRHRPAGHAQPRASCRIAASSAPVIERSQATATLRYLRT